MEMLTFKILKLAHVGIPAVRVTQKDKGTCSVVSGDFRLGMKPTIMNTAL